MAAHLRNRQQGRRIDLFGALGARTHKKIVIGLVVPGVSVVLPPIALTHSMHAQLSILVRLLRGSNSDEVLEFLEQELARANLVGADELDPRVAAVGRCVLNHEDVANIRKIGVLVLSGDEHRVAGGLSLIEPEGACLLGLSEGQSIAFWSESNVVCKVTLEAIV